MWTNVIMPLNYQWDELLLLGRSMSKLCFGGKSYLVFRRSTALTIISATEAIVRLAPNNSDVYMGHNTWTGFYSMLRLLKDSDFDKKPMESWSISAICAEWRVTCSSFPLLFREEYDLPVGGSADRVVQSGFLAAFWQIQNISKIWDSKSAMKLHATPDSKNFLRCRL